MATAKKLPSGSWRVNLFIGTEDGKRKYKSFTAATKREAEFQAAQYSADAEAAENAEITLGKAIDDYIESRSSIVSPSTVKGYYVVRKQYMQELMSLPVKNINQAVIQHAINEFAKNHSPKTCRNAHGLISAVLKIHKPSLVLRTTLPQPKKRDIYVPDEEEVNQIFLLVKGTALEVPFVLATQCGLRESEIAALRTENITKTDIYIKEAQVEGIDGQCLKGPKSQAGYRSVPINNSVYNVLISHADNITGRITDMTGTQISSAWSKFRSKNRLNPKLNFHALRHHFASNCLLVGMPQKYTAAIMGHSSTDMIERVYQHVFENPMETFARKLRSRDIYTAK